MLPEIALALALTTAGGLNVTQFTLEERADAVRKLFREEPHSTVSPAGRVLQFHGSPHAPGCDDGRQWVFFFETSGRLLSVTHNLETPRRLSVILPKGATVRAFQTQGGFPVLRAVLPGGRELVAAGARSTGDPVSQIQILRPADISRIYPDLTPLH